MQSATVNQVRASEPKDCVCSIEEAPRQGITRRINRDTPFNSSRGFSELGGPIAEELKRVERITKQEELEDITVRGGASK